VRTILKLIGAINRMSAATDNAAAVLAQLDADVKALVAAFQAAGAATQAAVDAQANTDAASASAIDAQVKAVLPVA
jgi:hypothetical protein